MPSGRPCKAHRFGNPEARSQRAEARFNTVARCLNSVRRFKAMQSLRARCRTQEKAPLLARLHEIHKRKTLRQGYLESPIDLPSAKQVLESFKPVLSKMTDCTAWLARLTPLGRRRFLAQEAKNASIEQPWIKHLAPRGAEKRVKRAGYERSWPKPWWQRVLPDSVIRRLAPTQIFDRRQMMIERLRSERQGECQSWQQAQANLQRLSAMIGGILNGQNEQFRVPYIPKDSPTSPRIDPRNDPRYDDDYFHKPTPAVEDASQAFLTLCRETMANMGFLPAKMRERLEAEGLTL